MDNTKDTPIDYKQFEGHTPTKPRCQYELWVEEYFGLPNDFPVEGTSKDFDYGQMVNMLAMFDAKRNEFHKANLDNVMNELDLENASLKLELQKQKEINAELVNEIEQLILHAEEDSLTYSVLEHARKLIFKITHPDEYDRYQKAD